MAETDTLCVFAVMADESRSKYVRPTMREAGSGLVLKQARHPILDKKLNDGVEFISKDIDLRRQRVPNRSVSSGDDDGDDDDDDEVEKENDGSLVLVNGPNMGDKSTYIRSAGVLTLMAHIGMSVPAEEALISVTDRIFTRVGAADNQHRAVSTFISEMLETVAILRNATCISLVIIDERGRGTGTTDGYGQQLPIIVLTILILILNFTNSNLTLAIVDNSNLTLAFHILVMTPPTSTSMTTASTSPASPTTTSATTFAIGASGL